MTPTVDHGGPHANLTGDGWIHVAFTVWDKAPQMSTKLYVNGNLAGEVTASPGVLELSSDIHVGNNPVGPDPYVVTSLQPCGSHKNIIRTYYDNKDDNVNSKTQHQ